ncbi:MAG: hypothetical protein COU42_01650 [Candidatus Nealsonbacteria bacterium CG10_big_fil_rev_8_21_14_0_10_36_24]|uniref:Membrane fusion protein biotin-lipoyl like domain-containing protein n=2 Tax=Candidatus Nealsoniibacteriota TaxID=1817911 RepID=A0A2H0YMT1_9BACT|nr:MAG: hypothetical protein COU42_01650 [Candidatus Nealsonbacteria bacterium CG10_big_fil_rev_8_21_14_0_10_36_24]PIS39815.1 MAG: hypothetical protein COT32_03035 [Candidatus Nealsonbacteria bacterium CG08_land_8_20_14_0_20_36_22]
MRKKIILIVIVIVVVLGFVIYQFFIKKEKPEFVLEKVAMATVLKEVSETGMVKISEETKLGFKNAGRIEKILVKVGDVVEAGKELAKLETNQLLIELTEAKADIEVAKAKKTDAKASLETAKQDLKDIEAGAEEDLKNAYGDALNTLDDAYLKMYNAFNTVSDVQKTYFNSTDQESIQVKESKDKIENVLEQTKSYIAQAKSDFQNEKIDTALSKIKDYLSDTKEALEIVRDITERPSYRDTISSSDKTSLDNQKSYINTGFTNLINAQQTISTTKITNDTNINNAKSKVSALEIQLKEEGENIGLYPAQVNQCLAKISLLENQIQEAILKNPGDGQITKINKREGEIVQPTDFVISFLPSAPFQIEVDIYEEDIVNVKIGDPVRITLAAFPDEVLEGKVVLIDPAEKLIEGVVYYKVTIDFKEAKESIKPGMTADIVIESAKKDNVLVIPKRTIEKINGKKIVKVFKNGNVKEREIEIGLEGSNDLVEVISGLKEGEEVVIE